VVIPLSCTAEVFKTLKLNATFHTGSWTELASRVQAGPGIGVALVA